MQVDFIDNHGLGSIKPNLLEHHGRVEEAARLYLSAGAMFVFGSLHRAHASDRSSP
jgi:hypothetical protein